ncbi:Sac2 family protein [Stachybotrys elegans]|uniref:Sac2 family protein n=1 Tax=Stachybotrys elegans TaxID=80388 RepID=A0A8K0T0Q0_9HYPO|nr:Sac2 family protein [Stachybotrys elegans]
MWLDRLAGAQPPGTGTSTPQPASRPYSPLPRRTSSNLSPYVTSQRAGHSPRASSVSLVSTDSSVSLLASSRKPNGSALKQSSLADDGEDPLKTLEKLLSSLSSDQDDDQDDPTVIAESDMDFEPDFGGLSLKEFAALELPESTTLGTRPPQAVDQYEKDKSKFEDLHRSITACDDVLNSVETNLTSFRNDLAAVSADIESLQTRSTALNRRLENRKAVEKALGPLVEELSVPPDTITKITEGHIDEQWLKVLAEVDKRNALYQKKLSSSQQNKASEDLGPLLEKLTLKAIERIRDFLVTQIKSMRSPHINAQIIQQQNFLRFKDLFAFLHKHHATLAGEISQAYMNTMRWYYLNQFGRYEKALAKLKLHVLDKNDVLGHEEVQRKATVLSSSRVVTTPRDAFGLGRRMDVLKSKNQPALPSYLAEEDQTAHYLEVPFRNFNLALIDNASAEYNFLANFFTPAISLAAVSKNFSYIFEPTFELGQTLSKSLVGDTFDALGLLLCIRLNQHFAFELQRRRIPTLDGYVNATNMLLWPRLQVIMDRHCESVRQLTNAVSAKAARSAADQAKLSAAPHVITQRFGQLLQGFLTLSTEAGDDEPVALSLTRLRSEVEMFLTRNSQSFGDKRKSQRFLYNNFSLILTIIGDIDGKLAAEQQKHFEQLKASYQE